MLGLREIIGVQPIGAENSAQSQGAVTMQAGRKLAPGLHGCIYSAPADRLAVREVARSAFNDGDLFPALNRAGDMVAKCVAKIKRGGIPAPVGVCVSHNVGSFVRVAHKRKKKIA